MMVRGHNDIPSEYKAACFPVVQGGARISITKHARLRYWQRLRQGVTDQEILNEAVRALSSGEPRFRFRAYIYDNPHRPTIIKLVTVLSDEMRIPPFSVDCRWERDDKWHSHLAELEAGELPKAQFAESAVLVDG